MDIPSPDLSSRDGSTESICMAWLRMFQVVFDLVVGLWTALKELIDIVQVL